MCLVDTVSKSQCTQFNPSVYVRNFASGRPQFQFEKEATNTSVFVVPCNECGIHQDSSVSHKKSILTS